MERIEAIDSPRGYEQMIHRRSSLNPAAQAFVPGRETGHTTEQSRHEREWNVENDALIRLRYYAMMNDWLAILKLQEFDEIINLT